MNEHGASPSVWPVTLAGGLSLAAFGLVTSLAFTIVGAVITLLGLAGWIGELRHG